MSTKLNAEELAAKRYDNGYMHMDDMGRCFDITRRLRECAATTIREVAQPIADERDELREALKAITSKAGIGIPYYAYGVNEAACRMADELSDIEKTAEAILAKYPRP